MTVVWAAASGNDCHVSPPELTLIGYLLGSQRLAKLEGNKGEKNMRPALRELRVWGAKWKQKPLYTMGAWVEC